MSRMKSRPEVGGEVSGIAEILDGWASGDPAGLRAGRRAETLRRYHRGESPLGPPGQLSYDAGMVPTVLILALTCGSAVFSAAPAVSQASAPSEKTTPPAPPTGADWPTWGHDPGG